MGCACTFMLAHVWKRYIICVLILLVEVCTGKKINLDYRIMVLYQKI